VLHWVLVIVVVGYSSLVAVVFFGQRASMYRPPSKVRTSPASVGMSNADDVIIDTNDGEKLVAWHVPPRDGQPVVVFFHGGADLLSWRVTRFLGLTTAGNGLIAPCFRGYSGSSGWPSEAGFLLDAAAAYRFARERYAPDRIVVWGFSIGSAVAVALAAKERIAGLILEAPFTSVADLAAAAIPCVPMRLILRDQFRADALITKVAVPLLVLHGELDKEVAISFAERLFTLASEPKQFVRFPKGGHKDLDAHGAIATVRRFLVRFETASSTLHSAQPQ
jgi:uncharacterized protein